ncbi:hypothetical protein CQ065_11655 [Pseudomonas sp. MYb187]|nr:hypothetical protein CQ065_11655 [Pseudomonas sp. MYb187]
MNGGQPISSDKLPVSIRTDEQGETRLLILKKMYLILTKALLQGQPVANLLNLSSIPVGQSMAHVPRTLPCGCRKAPPMQPFRKLIEKVIRFGFTASSNWKRVIKT